jgi:hypothetical protein
MSEIKYKAVILVLASNDNEIYKNARKIWKKYMYLDDRFKVFFVYGKLFEQLDDYDSNSDLIYPEIEEQFPVLIRKTINAMENIDNNFKYDYLVRTNLSTFWDFDKLYNHLVSLPNTLFYSGDGPLYNHIKKVYYLSGVDTIVTKEMITSIVNNKHLVDYECVEDEAMGRYFLYILHAPILKSKICFFEDIKSTNENDKILLRIADAIKQNCDHYRVKSLSSERLIIDMHIYKILLKVIYKIDYDIK